MARITILSPVVKGYHIVVSVPMKASLLIVKGQTIGEAIESLKRRRENERNRGKQQEYDRARALLMWGESINAELVSMSRKEERLYVTLSFKEQETVEEFSKFLAPNVGETIEEFHIVVSIPMRASILIIKSWDLEQAEKAFIAKRDNKKNRGKQQEYDRGRALMKWAYTSNAKLVSMFRADEKLYVTLRFNNLKELNAFNKYLVRNVDGATMK